MDDAKVGKRFDDVIYLYGESRALTYSCEQPGGRAFVDVPYRVMVPKRIDGLLAVGRSALGHSRYVAPEPHPPCSTWARWAASRQHMAAKAGVTPRNLDVDPLQATVASRRLLPW